MCLWLKGGDTVYYDLTKEEYKKKECDFKKTYVGKYMFTKWLISYIVFLVFIVEILFSVITVYIDNVQYKLDIIDIFYLVAILLIGIITVLYQIEYRKELKDFINIKK